MDDSARRISRWRHRAHSPRALFDAHTALCAIKAETDRTGALEHAKKAFGCAADDDEKLTAHKNLSYVLRKPGNIEDLAKADELDKLGEALEKKIKEGGKEVDEVINGIRTEAVPPVEEGRGEEVAAFGGRRRGARDDPNLLNSVLVSRQLVKTSGLGEARAPPRGSRTTGFPASDAGESPSWGQNPNVSSSRSCVLKRSSAVAKAPAWRVRRNVTSNLSSAPAGGGKS